VINRSKAHACAEKHTPKAGWHGFCKVLEAQALATGDPHDEVQPSIRAPQQSVALHRNGAQFCKLPAKPKINRIAPANAPDW
jgi:hypothetical protein